MSYSEIAWRGAEPGRYDDKLVEGACLSLLAPANTLASRLKLPTEEADYVLYPDVNPGEDSPGGFGCYLTPEGSKVWAFHVVVSRENRDILLSVSQVHADAVDGIIVAAFGNKTYYSGDWGQLQPIANEVAARIAK